MLQAGSLQVPSTGTGRSRFSKALPAIPGLDTSHVEESRAFSSSTTSPTAVLPTPVTPLRSPGDSELPPPPPPPHNDDPRTPIQFTPLPPIPKKRIATATPGPAPTEATAPATPATGLPKMMIPRRPVGSTKHTARTPSITSPVNQGVISGQTQVQVPAQEQPAPAPAPPVQQQQQTPSQSLPSPKASEPPAQFSPQRPLSISGPETWSPRVRQPKETGNEATQAYAEPKVDAPNQVQPRAGPAEGDDVRPQEASTALFLDPSQPAQPLRSPADSVLSILSAYSRSSTESVYRSSDGTYSTRDSHTNDEGLGIHAPPMPPLQAQAQLQVQVQAQVQAQAQAPTPIVGASSSIEAKTINHPVSTIPAVIDSSHSQPAQPQEQQPPSVVEPSSSPLPPPPPSKDPARRLQRPSPAPAPTPAPAPVSTPAASTTPDLRARSPPREQLWTRRTGKGSRDLPDLQLNHSFGSTAVNATPSPAPTFATTFTTVPTTPKSVVGLRKPSQTRADFTTTEVPPPLPQKQPTAPTVEPSTVAEQSAFARTMGNGTSKFKQLKDKLIKDKINKDVFSKDVFNKDVFSKDVFNRDKFHFPRRSEDGGSRSRKNSMKDTTAPEPPIPEFPQPGMTRLDLSKAMPSLPKQPSADTAKPEPPLPSSLTSQSAWPNTPKTEPIPAQAKWPMPPTGPPTLAQGNWPEPPKGGPSLVQENWPEPPKHGRIPSQSANEIVEESPEKKVNQAPPRLSLAKSGSGFFDLSSDWLEQHRAAPTQLETVEEPAIDDFQSPPYPPTKNPAKELVEEPGKTAIQEPSRKVIDEPAKEPIKGPTNELKESSQNINKEASQDSQGNDQKSRPTGYRPPTPEYQKEDVKTPIVDSFASPLSPASSPEPPNNESAQDLPKAQSENQPTVMKKEQLVSEVKVETQPPPMKPTPGDPILKAPQPVSAPAPTTPRRLSLDMRSRAGTPL
uniref:Uncharacterized protein n=1 Tax=Bionectria ochroleuca TaxID=29856 RepID=A0A8H7TPS0_BIOOC